MSSLNAMNGWIRVPKRPPMQSVKAMSCALYEALKLDDLDFAQRRAFSECACLLVLPTSVMDKTVHEAWIEASGRPLRAFWEQDRLLFGRWNAALMTLVMPSRFPTLERFGTALLRACGTRTRADARRDAVRARLALLALVIEHAQCARLREEGMP